MNNGKRNVKQKESKPIRKGKRSRGDPVCMAEEPLSTSVSPLGAFYVN